MIGVSLIIVCSIRVVKYCLKIRFLFVRFAFCWLGLCETDTCVVVCSLFLLSESASDVMLVVLFCKTLCWQEYLQKCYEGLTLIHQKRISQQSRRFNFKKRKYPLFETNKKKNLTRGTEGIILTQ